MTTFLTGSTTAPIGQPTAPIGQPTAPIGQPTAPTKRPAVPIGSIQASVSRVLASRRSAVKPPRTKRTVWDNPATSYYVMLGATALLLILGLVMVLSASAVESIAAGKSPYAQFLNQARFAAIGIIALVVAMRIPVDAYRKLALPGLIAAMALQMLTFIPALALTSGGNSGWIGYGTFTMQPAEVGKLALALWLGVSLSRNLHRIEVPRYLIASIGGAGAIIGLILLGHDLGTAIIVLGIAIGAFWVAGVPVKYLALSGAGVALFLGYVFIFAQSNSNRLNRIFAVFDPNCDVKSLCYQTQHGLFALGSGGVFGVGLGASREKWRYLPEAHNDFIYAIIGEELGLFGTMLILALFTALALAMVRVIRRHPDPFVKITTTAIACWIVGQALVNIGVVLGVLPVIGLPLPLVSAGGSALVTTLAALGITLSFARDEPGATEVLTTRSSVVKRSFAVLAPAT